MQTIGFAETYYTLWDVSEPYTIQGCVRQDYTYVKNLAMNLEIAKGRMKGEYLVDLELRGSTSFTRNLSEVVEEDIDRFPYGKLKGQLINESVDTWQLFRVKQSGGDRGKLASNRLLALGELVEYEGEMILPKMKVEKEIEKLKAGGAGLHFLDGEKVETELKEIERFHFEGTFGLTSVVTYITQDGKILKYMGGTPIRIGEGFVKVKFTIKHSEYKGVAETKIIRLKCSQILK